MRGPCAQEPYFTQSKQQAVTNRAESSSTQHSYLGVLHLGVHSHRNTTAALLLVKVILSKNQLLNLNTDKFVQIAQVFVVPVAWGKLSQRCSAAQCRGHGGQTPSPGCLHLWPGPPLPKPPEHKHTGVHYNTTEHRVSFPSHKLNTIYSSTCPTAYIQSSGSRI